MLSNVTWFTFMTNSNVWTCMLVCAHVHEQADVLYVCTCTCLYVRLPIKPDIIFNYCLHAAPGIYFILEHVPRINNWATKSNQFQLYMDHCQTPSLHYRPVLGQITARPPPCTTGLCWVRSLPDPLPAPSLCWVTVTCRVLTGASSTQHDTAINGLCAHSQHC